MSDSSGTCEYVLDPDDPETWGGDKEDKHPTNYLHPSEPKRAEENRKKCYINDEWLNENGVWSCPHTAEAAKNLCIFHLPVEEKDDEEVIESFLESINKSDRGNNRDAQNSQFLSAKFGRIDIEKSKVPTERQVLAMNYCQFKKETDFSGISFDNSVDFRGAQFSDDAHFTYSEFGGSLNFSGVNFRDNVEFSSAEFRDSVKFNSAKFGGDTRFRHIECDGGADFTNAQFSGDTDFTLVEFGDDAYFANVEFDDNIKFSSAKFGGDTDFADTEFNSNTDFTGTKFSGSLNFNDANFRDKVEFSGAEFGADTDFADTEFSGDTDFTDTEFGSNADFKDAEFSGDADFTLAEFNDNTIFYNTTFNSDIDFFAAEFSSDTKFIKANLTDASFKSSILQSVNLERALLSRSTLFDTDLRGAKLSGAVLGDVRINDDTKFLGRPSNDSDTSSHTFSAIRSQPKCVYDPDYEEDNEHADVDKAKSIYRALEDLGGKHARPRLQARSFVRRQDLQKQDYWDDATADNAPLEERLIAGARWSRARVARMTLLYGESPWRVIGWSLGIIFSFALLYPLGGWMKPTEGDPITYAQIASNPAEILNSIYYSTLTYTALGFGDFQPVGIGRLLTTIETGLGAVMLALLVFILGRRAAR